MGTEHGFGESGVGASDSEPVWVGGWFDSEFGIGDRRGRRKRRGGCIKGKRRRRRGCIKGRKRRTRSHGAIAVLGGVRGVVEGLLFQHREDRGSGGEGL